MWVRVHAPVEAELTEKELLRPGRGVGSVQSARREHSPGQDFHFNDQAAGGGRELGPGAMDKNQFGSDPPLEPLKLFILSRLWGKIAININAQLEENNFSILHLLCLCPWWPSDEMYVK